MINLDIPRVKQTSQACGPAALLQVLKFFGFIAELDVLIKNLDMSKEEFNISGVSEGTLALYALKNGFDVEIVCYDTKRCDSTWVFDDKQKLLELMKKSFEFMRKASKQDYEEGYVSYYNYISTKHLIEFLSYPESKFSWKPVSHELLREYLDEGTPVIALVNTQLYYDLPRRYKREVDPIRGKQNGHWLVVSGYSDNKYWMTDPDDDYVVSGKYEMDKDKLLNSIIQYGPVLIIVKPK